MYNIKHNRHATSQILPDYFSLLLQNCNYEVHYHSINLYIKPNLIQLHLQYDMHLYVIHQTVMREAFERKKLQVEAAWHLQSDTKWQLQSTMKGSALWPERKLSNMAM